MTEDLNQYFDHFFKKLNTSGIADFEDYSPAEMQSIFYSPFESGSPIRFNVLSETDYQAIPMLNQIKYLARIIEQQGEIKLTAKGFLPTKVVAELYRQGFLKDRAIELGISKLYKETDSSTISLPRILLELSGLVKKRNNKLSLTKKGQQVIQDDTKLLPLIFKIFAKKFNWAYYDGYDDNGVGQIGVGFTLILLSNYGKERKIDRFYADKYFRAFPHLVGYGAKRSVEDLDRSLCRAYSLRTFDRFLKYFELITIEEEKKGWDEDKFIQVTALFDKLFDVRPPLKDN